MKDRRYAVAGGGYVGLSIAVALSCTQDVVIYDIDETRVGMINQKVSPLRDKLIEEFMSSKELNLRATTDYKEAFGGANAIIVAVPTNYDTFTKSFDVSLVDDTIAKAAESASDTPVIIKSTVPIGYTKEVSERFPSSDIVFSPEFLREGRALEDVLRPSRTIIGRNLIHDDDNIHYRKLTDTISNYVNDLCNKRDIIWMSSTEAECVKLFANTYLAGRVAFFNELDSFAMNHGLDAKKIIMGVCGDPRIGDHYNNPSFGYGGYCFPKDTKQLLTNYESTNGKSTGENLISAIVDSNVTRKYTIALWVIGFLGKIDKDERTVGIHSLAMKSGSDNCRCSAVLDIMRTLDGYVYPDGKKIKVVIYDDSIHTDMIGFDEDTFYEVMKDKEKFLSECDCILTNRMDKSLEPVKDKVLTRDAFGVD